MFKSRTKPDRRAGRTVGSGAGKECCRGRFKRSRCLPSRDEVAHASARWIIMCGSRLSRAPHSLRRQRRSSSSPAVVRSSSQ